jgi:hypothetical protein
MHLQSPDQVVGMITGICPCMLRLSVIHQRYNFAVYGVPLSALWEYGVPTHPNHVHEWRWAVGMADGTIKSDYRTGFFEGCVDQKGREACGEETLQLAQGQQSLTKRILLGGFGKRPGARDWAMVHFVAWEGMVGASQALACTTRTGIPLRLYMNGTGDEVDWDQNTTIRTDTHRAAFLRMLAAGVRSMRVGEISEMSIPHGRVKLDDECSYEGSIHVQVEVVCINQHMLTDDGGVLGSCQHAVVCISQLETPVRAFGTQS